MIFFKRVIRALTLEAALFEEVEADRGATAQAIGVVLLSGLAAGIGSSGRGLAGGILLLTTASFLAWVVWAWITYVIGTKVLPGSRTEADVGQLLRTVGVLERPGGDSDPRGDSGTGGSGLFRQHGYGCSSRW